MQMNTRKTLAVAAAALVAGAAHQAHAADVTVFGFLDEGVSYLHEDLNAGMAAPAGQLSPAVLGADGLTGRQGSMSRLALGSGNVNTIGIKGSEVLSDDLSVIFHMESGFLADSGEFYGSPLFERESSVGLRSKAWGEIKFGRMPALTTGSGTTGIFNSRTNPFGAGWGNMTGGWKFAGTLAKARWNNMVNYVSPSMSGLRVHLQHSMGDKSDATEGTADADRWTAAGVSWTAERAYFAAAVDWLKAGALNARTQKDAWKALAGGHVKFDAFKLYGAVEYMKNVPYIGGYSTKEWAPLATKGQLSSGFEGWALATGVDVPAAGGTIKASVGYGFGENQNTASQNEYDRVNVGLAYTYPLSKRTTLYGCAGWFRQDADWQEDYITAHEAILGMMHRF